MPDRIRNKRKVALRRISQTQNTLRPCQGRRLPSHDLGKGAVASGEAGSLRVALSWNSRSHLMLLLEQ